MQCVYLKHWNHISGYDHELTKTEITDVRISLTTYCCVDASTE
jgi:hypothetical protein